MSSFKFHWYEQIIYLFGRNSSVGGSKSLKNASSCGSVSGRSVHPDLDNDFPGVEQIRNLLKDGRTPEYVLTMLGSNVQQKPPEENHNAAHCRSVVDMPTFVKQSEKVCVTSES